MDSSIVIGLGGMGSATAYHLARQGVRVVGFDQYSLGHNRGSSHGHSRVIRQAYFEHPDYVPLLLRAYELWRELEQQSGRSLLTITGGLMIGTPESPVFRGSVASATEHGLEHEILDATEIHRRFPPLVPSNEYVALYETQAGVLRPEAAVRTHCELAHHLGADLHWSERVLRWSTTTNGVEVVTDRGVYAAESLVICPGAWARSLIDWELPLKVTRQTLFWFEPNRNPESFRSDRFPIYIWQSSVGDEFYGFPVLLDEQEPRGVKIAYFYRPCEVTPDEPRTPISPREVDAMRDAFRDKIPSLDGPLVQAISCLYTETPDHHFAIGHHPSADNVVVASPCSGHGFKFCSVIGEVLADLAMGRTSRHRIAIFDPNRWSRVQ